MKNNFFERYKYNISSHIKNNLLYIILGVVFIIVGIVLGIILSNGDKSYFGIIGKINKNMSAYISGIADTVSIFWRHLFVGLSAFSIIFLLSLNYFSSFVSLVYIAYQSCITTIAILSLCSIYGLSSIMTSIFYLVPTNLIMLIIVSIFYSICAVRSQIQYKQKLQFIDAFSTDFWLLFSTCLLIYFSFIIIIDLIFPAIFRGIFIINY